MNSFSISAYGNQHILNVYTNWLEKDIYRKIVPENIDDPAFLQKLSILQADGIRHDIGMHAAITHASIQAASDAVSNNIQSAANLLTSSLDKGFFAMNNRMVNINRNLTNLGQGLNAVNINMSAGMKALQDNISQATAIITYRLQQVDTTIKAILNELKIPESQRERRYHIEEGVKYFNKAMLSGNALYFDDALDEFTKAITIERKDYFSWYYLGMIYLYSKQHLDIAKALDSFEHYIHYADALTTRHYLFDEALIMIAECHYLEQDTNKAFNDIEAIIPNNTKAALRGIKYLSASRQADKQKQAAEIFQKLMQENPYIAMQVLEDYDLVNNDFILQHITNYKKKLLTDIPSNIHLLTSLVESVKDYVFYDEYLNKVLSLNKEVFNINKTSGLVDFLIIADSIHGLIDDIQTLIKETNDLHPFEEEGKYGFRTYKKVYLKCQWKDAIRFSDGLAAVMNNDGLWGFIDIKGKLVIPYRKYCYQPGDFHDGMALIEDGFINKKGKLVINLEKNNWCADGFKEGLARVWDRDTRKCGYINTKGDIVLPLIWENAGDFHEGMAFVGYNNKYGFINTKGELVIPYKWTHVVGFRDGIALVSDERNKWGAIDKNGKLVCSCIYDSYSKVYVTKQYSC